VAAVGIPAGVLLIYLGGWVLATVLALVAVISLREFYHLARVRGGAPSEWLGVGATLLLMGAVAAAPGLERLALWGWGLSLTLALGALGVSVWRPGPGEGGAPLASASVTVTGFLYAAGTLSFGLLLRELPPGVGGGSLGLRWEGALLLIYPLVVTWVGDSSAYFVGKRWGRRKLIPAVSPGKTVAGAWGGLAGAVLSSVVYAAVALSHIPGLLLTLPWAVAVGLVLGGAAQVGDLAESALKREAEVKDSGTLLPGHGGAMDRFDAVFFTLPLTYLLLQLRATLL